MTVNIYIVESMVMQLLQQHLQKVVLNMVSALKLRVTQIHKFADLNFDKAVSEQFFNKFEQLSYTKLTDDESA